MSELKEHLFVPYSELQEGDELTDAITIAKSYYLKSEADKVIARHKYKRCLAMANYWGLVSACTHGEIQLKCMRRELKWHKLAEKFKEAK